MKCPLILNKQVNYAGKYGRVEKAYFGDCIKEECAWWNPAYGECSVKMATCFLDLIRSDTKFISIARRVVNG